MHASPRALLALALDRIDGVGRVTTGRVLRHFESYHALTAYPREQVLLRLKGSPNAERLVAQLFDPERMAPHLEAAEAELRLLEERGIVALVPGDEAWPAGISALPAGDRPIPLLVYGPPNRLQRPLVAFFGKAALREAAFDAAQMLVRWLGGRGIAPVVGATHGCDVVLAKVSAMPENTAPAVMICGCGLAHVPPPVRPTASATVRAGGALVSGFPMNQPHYPHQDDDQALLMAALAPAGVFLDPEDGGPAWKAMHWMLEAGKAVFAIPGGAHPLPERVHLLASEVDYEWVATAAAGAA